MTTFNVLITFYSAKDPSSLICYIPYINGVGDKVDEHGEEICNHCCAIPS